MDLGRVPTGPIRQVVRMNSETYTIRRASTSTSETGVSEESFSDSHSEGLWLFSPTETRNVTELGERRDAALNGLALPESDVRVGDRVTHDGVDYEVTEVDDRLSGDSTTDVVLSLEKVV